MTRKSLRWVASLILVILSNFAFAYALEKVDEQRKLRETHSSAS